MAAAGLVTARAAIRDDEKVIPSEWRPPWVSAGYAAGVHVASLLTRRLAPAERTSVLRSHSTNVDNLRGGRWHTLLTSAFLVDEPLTSTSTAMLVSVLGAAESRWGTRRAAGIFALGHIGASLAVYTGLRLSRPSAETARAVDVGVSYGANAVAGALAAAHPRRGPRWAATASLVALATRPVLRADRTFTDAGHLAALLIGLGAGTTARRRPVTVRTAR